MSKILLLLAPDLFLKRVREEKHEKNRLKKKKQPHVMFLGSRLNKKPMNGTQVFFFFRLTTLNWHWFGSGWGTFLPWQQVAVTLFTHTFWTQTGHKSSEKKSIKDFKLTRFNCKDYLISSQHVSHLCIQNYTHCIAFDDKLKLSHMCIVTKRMIPEL